jgi:hypothetical protein
VWVVLDPVHFSEVDYSSAQNDFGGVNNAPNYANKTAFAAFLCTIPLFKVASDIWGNINPSAI